MAFVTKVHRFAGLAQKAETPEASIMVTLEKGPLDMKTGEQISSVLYANDQKGMEEAIEAIGPGRVRQILRDGEKVECHVPVEYHDWE